MDLRINETLQTGAVRKPHLPGDESVYLFFIFRIHHILITNPVIYLHLFKDMDIISGNYNHAELK